VKAIAKVTHYSDGRVHLINLTTGEEEDVKPGIEVTIAGSGCAVLAAFILAFLAGALAAFG
jgi:hypothetical protein